MSYFIYPTASERSVDKPNFARLDGRGMFTNVSTMSSAVVGRDWIQGFNLHVKENNIHYASDADTVEVDNLSIALGTEHFSYSTAMPLASSILFGSNIGSGATNHNNGTDNEINSCIWIGNYLSRNAAAEGTGSYAVNSTMVGFDMFSGLGGATTCTAVGNKIYKGDTNPSLSVFIGNSLSYQAVRDLGDNNIMIGSFLNHNADSYANAIMLGNNVNATHGSSFWVSHIAAGTANDLHWNTTTKEVVYVVSTERAKKEIAPTKVNGFLDKLSQVELVEFVWKDKYLNKHRVGDEVVEEEMVVGCAGEKTELGVIAEQLKKIHPSLAKTNEFGQETDIDARSLLLLCVGAIQELIGMHKAPQVSEVSEAQVEEAVKSNKKQRRKKQE